QGLRTTGRRAKRLSLVRKGPRTGFPTGGGTAATATAALPRPLSVTGGGHESSGHALAVRQTRVTVEVKSDIHPTALAFATAWGLPHRTPPPRPPLARHRARR